MPQILSKRSYELADVTAGHVINLISKDLQPLQFVANFLPIALVGCFEFIAMGALLWYFISWMALAGMFYLVLFVVFQLASATPIRNFRSETQSVADRRMAIIKNVITGIRTVKMNSWEWLFERIVKNLRRLVIYYYIP